MERKLVCISGVRGYEENGVAFLHIEDVARGLGFEQEKNGIMYVRWDRVEQHLADLKFPTCGENEKTHDFYIPENIFYRLCMKAKNSVAEDFQAKVADEIIPSIRRTGSYSTEKTQTQFPLPATYIEALEALLASEKEKQRALDERDEAKRTKTLYQEGLASQMSGRVGGLQKANNGLRKENADLKDAVGRGCNWRTISMMRDEWIKEFGHSPSYHKLKQFSEDVKIPPVQDVEEKVVLKNGSEKTKLCYRYHKEAWARYRKYEENLRVSNAEVEAV